MQSDFLTQALGLQGLYVVGVSMSEKQIDLEVGRDDGGCYVCGRCGQICFVYHDRYKIHPQDLKISGRDVYLHLWRYRVFCSCCNKVVNENLPYIRPNAHMTIRLEEALHEECAETPVKAVAQRYNLSWATVRDVDLRILRERLSKQSLDRITWIGVDEVAHEKRHKYLTVVTDLKRRKVVRIYEGRKSKSLTAFFKEIGTQGCARIRCVVIDMWKPYRSAIRRHLRNALVIVDKFHVIKKVHEALDQVRKEEQSRLPKEERSVMKGSRWLLLQTLQTTQKKDRVPSLLNLLQLNAPLLKAYILKEEFREWYSLKPVPQETIADFFERVKEHLRKWYRHVHESLLEPFEGVVQTIKNWRRPILNHFLTGLSNGLSEGLNNVIKTIKKRAYGYRNKEYFILKIYQKVGFI